MTSLRINLIFILATRICCIYTKHIRNENQISQFWGGGAEILDFENF